MRHFRRFAPLAIAARQHGQAAPPGSTVKQHRPAARPGSVAEHQPSYRWAVAE
ncbi:hypothetical protein QQA05_06900 [Corynebacterium macclintockiae]|nr:hypothetical protein [Corynebacterium macclintockiae]